MKKKLWVILAILCSLFLVGCGEEMTARSAVRDYLENYVTLDSRVVEELNNFVDSQEDLNNEQKMIYKEILRKQYSSLTYNIQNERYEGDFAYLKTKINVIDLYKVQKEALDYFNEHTEQFNNEDGDYDRSLFTDYRLEKMKEATETTTYEIEFKVVKSGNDWEVTQLSNEDLEKIHGIYNDGE